MLSAKVITRQSGDTVERAAKVLEWTGELDALSKTVQVLVEIEDPLSLKPDNVKNRAPCCSGHLSRSTLKARRRRI